MTTTKRLAMTTKRLATRTKRPDLVTKRLTTRTKRLVLRSGALLTLAGRFTAAASPVLGLPNRLVRVMGAVYVFTMPFVQTPPALEPAYTSDRVLRGYLARVLPRDVLAAIEPQLTRVGELAAGPLYDLLLADLKAEPRLTQWDAWGHRVDRDRAHAALEGDGARHRRRRARRDGVRAQARRALARPPVRARLPPRPDHGRLLVPARDDRRRGEDARLDRGNTRLIDRALPRLTSRDPATAWTSGQWMTERTGGSDVAIAETVARHEAGGRLPPLRHQVVHERRRPRRWRSRSRGPKGTRRAERGSRSSTSSSATTTAAMNGIPVNRLKDKLGTRMVPTAELTLDGARGDRRRRGRRTASRTSRRCSTITRTWNAVCAVSGMRTRSRSRATTPGGASRSARRSATSRCTPTRSPGCRPSTRARSTSRSARSSCSGGKRRGRSRRTRRSSCGCSRRSRSSRPASKRCSWRARRSRRSAARATSRTRGCRGSCATRRCCRSGKGRRTCSRSTCCARSRRTARPRRHRGVVKT